MKKKIENGVPFKHSAVNVRVLISLKGADYQGEYHQLLIEKKKGEVKRALDRFMEDLSKITPLPITSNTVTIKETE